MEVIWWEGNCLMKDRYDPANEVQLWSLVTSSTRLDLLAMSVSCCQQLLSYDWSITLCESAVAGLILH